MNIATHNLNSYNQQNPYVSDGLIAMWDAKFNIGFDRHDSETTAWNDLINRNQFQVNGSNKFENNCFHVGSAIRALNTYTFDQSQTPTIELVFKVNKFSIADKSCAFYMGNSNGGHGSSDAFCSLYVDNVSIQCNRANQFRTLDSSIMSKITTLSMCESFVSPSVDGGCDIRWINGGKFYDSKASWYSPKKDNMYMTLRAYYYDDGIIDFYGIRLYDRKLTDEEVKRNYDMDKLRFGF